MRAFRFSLQRVLDVKRTREDLQRQVVAQAQADVAACAQRLEEVRAARRAAAAQAIGSDAAIDPGVRSMGWHHRAVLYHRAAALEEELARRQQILDKARDDLVIATKERQVLERLKERRQAAYEQEAARRDQAALDDLAAVRAVRVERRDAGRQRG